MNTFEAIVLGVVQGVTEFLPISSTAHLRVVPALAGWPDPGAAFTAVLQLGSLAAVIGYFFKDLVQMASASLKAVTDRSQPPPLPARQAFYVAVGTIPVVIAGLALKHKIEGEFRSLWVVAAAQLFFGLLLGFFEKKSSKSRPLDQLTLRDAILIGCAQAIAVVPGASRSGMTLTGALALGFQREAAARFSFLLSIPAVAGAGIHEMKQVLHAGGISHSTLAIGVVVTTIASYASIAWLLKFLRTRTTIPFVVYRVALGLLIFAMLFTGRL
jgi:undecaprenyl-diphosphatase